ncbi:hypothetical protein WA158_005210 [Blastocystis sp. Blastoise]
MKNRTLIVFLLLFYAIPPFASRYYSIFSILKVINRTLANPLINNFIQYFSSVKCLFLISIILLFIYPRIGSRLFVFSGFFLMLSYSILQSMSYSEENGFMWVISNTCIMGCVAIGWYKELIHNKCRFTNKQIDWKQIWILPIAFFCILFPVDFEGNIFNPNPVVSWSRFLTTDTTGAYCYITPALMGILILYYPYLNKEFYCITSDVCTIIGTLALGNFITEKGLYVTLMHLPLTFFAIYGQYVYYHSLKRKEKK